MKKRIAIISMHASPLEKAGSIDCGGQNIYVNHVARKLCESGLNVDVFSRKTHPDQLDVCVLSPRLRVIHIEAGPERYIEKEQLHRYVEDFADGMYHFMQIHGDYSLAHANFFLSGQVACILKERRGLPFLITFHALGKIRKKFQKKKDRFPEERVDIEKEIMQNADGIIAECPQDWIDMILHYKADPERMRIVPCGFDHEELFPVEKREARQRLGLPEKAPVILNLGRIVQRKGIDNIIRGFAKYHHRHPMAEAKLLIVGGESNDPKDVHTPELRRLRGLAQQSGVSQSVLFPGRADRFDLRYYYSAADLFVTTPWYEPFGITPIEAMACRVPVIASSVGGLKYSIIPHQTGILVPPNNPTALANRIGYLMNRPQIRARLSNNGYQRACNLFTWQRVSDMLLDFYHQVVEDNLAAAKISEQIYPFTMHSAIPQFAQNN